MKKLLGIMLALVLSITVLAGCGGKENSETTGDATQDGTETTTESTSEAIKVAALNGPTAMGMVQMMDSDLNPSAADYDFTIATAIDEVTASIVKGEFDIAAVPANVASVLYNKTEGGIQVLAINTLGVLYMIEKGEVIQSVEDLRGKTIYTTGKGATPEYALNYILQANGLTVGTDVTVEFKSESAECIAVMAEQEDAIAMLPQPFVTSAMVQDEAIRIALNMTEEWDKVSEDSSLLTGVVIARTEFAETNQDKVDDFMDQYQASVDYVNSNTEDAADLIEANDIVAAAVAQKALPYCNITFIEGTDMQSKLSGYLNVLYEQNPESVGGNLPNEDFYYQR
ncbi:MAG: ABC transporter substrate-binding protein [Lachnospiraceae bacterium]